MKKLTKLMAILMALCLITSSFVGSTLAKYVTADEASDSARVAKFGVTVTATDEMFSNSYKNAKTTYTANEEGDAITVQAATDAEKVVAPGTQGSLAGFTVEGTPEVDVKVTYKSDLTLTGWEVDGAYYCPIEITITDNNADPVTPVVIKGTACADMADFESQVEAAINAIEATYDTNTNLATINDDITISWAWAYETGADADEKAANDIKDTKLGNAATAATIELDVTATVTQID